MVISQPISRSAVFWGKALALIMVCSHPSVDVGRDVSGSQSVDTIDLTALEHDQAIYFPVCCPVGFYMGFALFLSMIFSSGGTAGFSGWIFLIASYFITSLTRLDS